MEAQGQGLPLQTVSCEFIQAVLNSPERMARRVMLSIAYGIDVLPENDPYVADAEKVMQSVAIGTSKEATLLDSISWCDYFCVIWRPET